MFLTKCDQEKYSNVAWKAFMAGVFWLLTSSLLRDHLSPHLSPRVKNNLEFCVALFLSHFWLIVTKTRIFCLADKVPCVSNFCLLMSLLLHKRVYPNMEKVILNGIKCPLFIINCCQFIYNWKCKLSWTYYEKYLRWWYATPPFPYQLSYN